MDEIAEKLFSVQSSGAPDFDRNQIEAAYSKDASRLKALSDEIAFILETKLNAASFKLHGIEHRVKTLNSILGKCERKKCSDPFSKFNDIVGARVICLFKEDIDGIGALISDNFTVIEIDDKRSADGAPLGYLSVHYICEMPKNYTGPRYDSAANIRFEIQVRTLCMHCWANVSHYLEYKGDWDVPKELRLALSALSGLFYVADNEFQQIYAAKLKSQEFGSAKKSDNEIANLEINLDSITAYLKVKFPERPLRISDVSDLVHQMVSAGYKYVQEVDRDISKALPSFLKYEKKYPPGNAEEFSAVGVARLALVIASDSYWKLYAPSEAARAGDNIASFRLTDA